MTARPAIFPARGTADRLTALFWRKPRLLLALGFDTQARALYRAMTEGPDAPFVARMVWALGIVSCLLVIPAIALRASGGSLRDHGFRLDRSAHGWVYVALMAVMLPVVMLAALQPGFRDFYPLYRPAAGEGLWPRFFIWEATYVLQFVAVEFFFRGFLLHSARHRFGAWAIMLPLIPYVMVHFGKPAGEAAGALIAGAVLGYLSLRTGSIVYGIALHAGVALAMDATSLLLER